MENNSYTSPKGYTFKIKDKELFDKLSNSAKKYGFNVEEQLIAQSFINSPVQQRKLSGLKKLVDIPENLNDETKKELISKNDYATLKNKSLLNEALLSISSKDGNVSAMATVLDVNEFNNQLENLVGRIFHVDGFSYTEPDYSYFYISESQLGDIDRFNGKDLLASIGTWSVDISLTDLNPQIVPTFINDIKTQDRIKISWRTNAPVVSGAFLQSGDVSSEVTLENKKARDTFLEYFWFNVLSQDILASLTISIDIPGFADETSAVESIKIITKTIWEMNNPNRLYNEAGASRTVGASLDDSKEMIKVLNLCLIAGSDFFTESNNYKSVTFNQEFINLNKRVGKLIQDNNYVDTVALLVKERYVVNNRITASGSDYRIENLATNHFDHYWIRRGSLLDQQGVIFSVPPVTALYLKIDKKWTIQDNNIIINIDALSLTKNDDTNKKMVLEIHQRNQNLQNFTTEKIGTVTLEANTKNQIKIYPSINSEKIQILLIDSLTRKIKYTNVISKKFNKSVLKNAKVELTKISEIITDNEKIDDLKLNQETLLKILSDNNEKIN